MRRAGRRRGPRRRARTVQALVENDLLDEVQLHQVPVLFGGGVRLFDALPRLELDIVRVIDTPQATHLRYRVGVDQGFAP